MLNRDDLYQDLFGDADADLMARFTEFDDENPHVYREFERLADLAGKSSEKCGAWAIANYMRWNTIFGTRSDEEYKIPNDFIGLYGRKLVWNRPEFYDFFERRRMRPTRTK